METEDSAGVKVGHKLGGCSRTCPAAVRVVLATKQRTHLIVSRCKK